MIIIYIYIYANSYIGCDQSSPKCTTRLDDNEFDIYYKLQISCLDAQLVSIETQHEYCSTNFNHIN